MQTNWVSPLADVLRQIDASFYPAVLSAAPTRRSNADHHYNRANPRNPNDTQGIADMPTIDNQSPAEIFLESAVAHLEELKSFLLENVQLALNGPSCSRKVVEKTIMVDIFNPDRTVICELPLHVVIDPPAIASEIFAASLSKQLSVKPFQVLQGLLIQPRVILSIGRRVVGQLYSSRDGQSLELEVKERPDAQRMGNDVLAFGALNFNVHVVP